MHALQKRKLPVWHADIFLIFSEAQNSSQVIFNTSHGCTFLKALCSDWPFFCMTLQVDVIVPPTYFVEWTITFWLISLIPQDQPPIVYFIPLLWLLCVSEIAKIVDLGLWNSTAVICAVAEITSSVENMLQMGKQVKCCLFFWLEYIPLWGANRHPTLLTCWQVVMLLFYPCGTCEVVKQKLLQHGKRNV